MPRLGQRLQTKSRGKFSLFVNTFIGSLHPVLLRGLGVNLADLYSGGCEFVCRCKVFFLIKLVTLFIT
jgi:hypothetical protein